MVQWSSHLATGRSTVGISAQLQIFLTFFFHSFSPWTPDLLYEERMESTTAEVFSLAVMPLEVRQEGWHHGLTQWKKEECGPQGLYCILCKIMSVCNFVSCNSNEYIKETTSEKWSKTLKGKQNYILVAFNIFVILSPFYIIHLIWLDLNILNHIDTMYKDVFHNIYSSST